MLGFGLPNYFIFDLGVSSTETGLVNTFFCISYTLLLLFAVGKIADHIGRKNTLIFAIIGLNISYALYLIPLTPILAYFIRFLEGAFTAFFWPVLQSIISDLKKVEKEPEKCLSNYNLSWGFGAIFGFIFSAIAVYKIGNNYITFIIAEIFTLMLIPVIMALKIPSKEKIEVYSKSLNEKFQNPKKEQIPTRVFVNEFKIKKMKVNFDISQLPSLIPMFYVVIHAFLASSLQILVSRTLDINGIDSYLSYIFWMFRQIIMLLASLSVAKIRSNKIGLNSLMIGILYGLISIAFILPYNFAYYIILHCIFGYASIALYTYAIKIFLEKNYIYHTAKYTSLFEAMMGVGSGIGPYVTGIGADMDIISTFLYLGLFAIVISIIVFKLYEQEYKKITRSI
jgi:MFS family permease